ncbi:M23 family metallopeptidase, partial [Klebsiella pneumoniae]|nr:M23 family metallopeptidase [Klebsiella pneumoniae]
PDLREGMRLRAGDPVGAVGDTGNAGAGNTHLHFGIERLLPDEAWHQGRAIDPYPLLARGRTER